MGHGPRSGTAATTGGAVTVGVLALQGDVREHVALLDRLGAVPRLVRTPADTDGIRGLVLPGGESTTMSLLLESSRLDAELARLVTEGMPMLGTCAGMILLASEVLDGRPDQIALGAIDISVRRNGFGRQVESFETDLDVKGFDDPMHAVFIRAPLVERVGEGVDVLSEVELPRAPGIEPPGGEGRWRSPVVCSRDNVIVAAFHPELSGDLRLHELLLRRIEGD